ncbi:MAG: peptidyl-prolyl cis-trans isomerase, partial [Candidatus Krumholzibacteriota bacterium]|nr:peptidyl-prolyl cis-trans isomerase [Candidatus Krumholzibacteriota bacterium]
ERDYRRVNPTFLPQATGFEGKREFLTTMLNKAVMAYKADEFGYDKDPSVVKGMETFRKLGLQAGYLQRKVADKVTISDEEMRMHHENKGAIVNVKQILVDTPEQADEVWNLLEDGGDFDSILKNYSKAPDATAGGKVATIAYGKYAPALQWELFQRSEGEYTTPIYTGYGYFIIKILRRTQPTRERVTFEENREHLEHEVRATKEMIATNELTNKIREKYGVEWYWDNLYIAFEALPPDRDVTNPPRRQDEIYPLLYFEEEDMDRPLVTYKGKTIAIKDFSDIYDQGSFFVRPRREFRLAGINSYLVERIMNEILVEEMERSGIDRDPEVARALRGKREELMINRLYEDWINSKTVVNMQMIAEYYEEHEDGFVVPEKRKFTVILCGDQETALKAYQEVQSGTLFRNVAMAYTIDEESRRSLAETDLLAEGEQPEIDRVGFALPDVGSVSEPFQMSRGWMILKLTEQADSKTFSLEQARGSIQSALKQQLNEELLNQLLETWKEELGVVISDDNLRKTQIEERSAAAEIEANA